MTPAAPTERRFDLICVGDVAVDVYLTVSEHDAVVDPFHGANLSILYSFGNSKPISR